jgi:hypothetical protein
MVSHGGGGVVPPWSLEAALRRIAGVVEPMPLNRQFLRLPSGSRQGELVALDADSAAGVVALRDDLSATPFAELAARLADARPRPALARIETAPRRLEVRVRMAVDEVGVFVFDDELEEFGIEKRPIADVPNVAVGAEIVVRDGRGIVERFTAPSQPWSADGQTLVVDLAPVTPRTVAAVEEIGGGLTAPVEVLAVDVTVHLPSLAVVDEGRIELAGLAASPLAEGDEWAAVDLGDAPGWEVLLLRNDQGGSAPIIGRMQDFALVLDGEPIGGRLLGPSQPGVRPLAVSYVPGGLLDLADAPLPVIVNRAFLGATASQVGDEVTSRVGGLLRTLRVVGVVESFPTTDATQPQAIADLATVGLLAFAGSQSTVTPLEWWIATEPGAGSSVEAALRDGPYVRGEIASREGRARTLSADPVALGIIGALSLGFVVAGLFAVIGLTVSAGVSARQRRTEFALLRALGLSSGQLSGWLWLENAGVVIVSLAAGTGLGLLIGWVVLPFVTVTQEAAAPFPPPVVQTPWLSIGLLVLISTLALGATVVVLATILRRIGIGSVLRMGED